MIHLAVPLLTPGSLKEYTGGAVPEGFHLSVSRLIDHVRSSADTIVPGGTTGEGHLLTMPQYTALLAAVMKHRWELNVRAGILGRDDQVAEQVLTAQSLWIQEMMIGCGHTGDYEARVAIALEALWPKGRLFLYNMPGWFDPLVIEFVARYFREDKRVVGIKDSSGNPEYFEQLLALKGTFPNKIVSHGSEPLYGDMSPERRKLVDEVTAWTGNAYPKLLRNFLDNPEEFWAERTRSGSRIWDSHGWFNPELPWSPIGDYIYGLKTYLRLQSVLTGAEDFLMYGDKAKWFFPKD